MGVGEVLQVLVFHGFMVLYFFGGVFGFVFVLMFMGLLFHPGLLVQ